MLFTSNSRRSFAFAIFLILTQIGFAQSKVTVDGTVTDSNGNPVVAAFVVEKGTMNGATVDLEGNYKLAVAANSVVSVECIGYKTVEFKAEKSMTKNIVLEDDALALDDAVVVGYSTMTRRDLISSVSQVKTEEIGNLPATNITQGLAGRSPGLIVVQSNGGLAKTASISIRGGGTPLYVIDGVIRTEKDFQMLAPDDIDQMNVLKDASATAIYGSRAANGIIQIVTKRGTKDRVNVNYDFNQSFSQPGYWQKTLGIAERYELANQGAANDGLSAIYGDQMINNAKQHLDGQGRPMQFPRDVALRDWAPQTKHTIRVQGGSDVAQTYASFTNIHKETIFRNTETYQSNHYKIRLAETVNLRKAGLQINATLDGYWDSFVEPVHIGGSGDWGWFSHFQNYPENTYLNLYGLPLYSGGDNIVSEASADAGYRRANVYVINTKGEVIWNVPWVKGLKFRASTNYRFNVSDDKNWEKSAPTYDWDSDVPIHFGSPILTVTNAKACGYTNQIFGEYGNTFGKHTVSVLAGYEQYYGSGFTYQLQRKGYQFEVDQISVGSADEQYNSGSENEEGRAAFISQARYNYDNRYFIEGSFRYDGSDYFAKGKRWGPFFGGSIGWLLSNESWMQGLVSKDVFNMLKLRASYGQTGLDSSAGRFAYMQQYSLNATGYVQGGAFVPTFNEGALPSPDLTWYTTTQTDLGFDFASLGSRLYGSFDYFFYKTYGYLVAPTGQSYLNQIIGIGMPSVKSESEYRREGVELQLGWRDSIGDFHYDISGNITYYDSLWAYNQSESESSYMNPYTRGQQVSQNYYGSLLHNLGFYANQDEVFNSVAVLGSINTGNLKPGDLRFEDTNGDGQINSSDSRHLGKSSSPHCQFGLNFKFDYKGFYLSTLFQGSTSSHKYISDTYSMQTGQVGNLLTIYPFQKDTWTPSNTDAAFPRLTSSSGYNNNNNYQSSDFWLVNCAYLRMKDFQFGYDFKYALMKNANFISTFRLGLSGQNIFTISQAKKYGMDPENDASGYCYPMERTIALTLNIGFK